MGLNLDCSNGQTPIDEDEKHGLRIKTISTLAELDEFEQKNIEDAMLWLAGRKLDPERIITEDFIRNLHYRMYQNVWRWAGDFRKSNKNIGVDKWQISVALRSLCEDARYWLENKTYGPDEFALRFKHRLVSIHCFPNGNGRHSRLVADIIAEKIFGAAPFSWGSQNQVQPNETREIYIKALQSADQGDVQPLLDFARS